ncbi:hypothetical protein QQ045_030197 [Rhodiola kirilowii]
MNSSIKRHEFWLKSCADLGLSKRNIDIDVPSRWNSTYELLNVTVKYKTALHRYCLKINESRNCSLVVPSEHDWVVATLCMNFLSISSSATKVCSGVYSATANKVIKNLVDIYATFDAYQQLDSFRTAFDAMKLKFDKYWSELPIAFCLATIMDPRFKLLAIEAWLTVYDLSELEINLKIDELKSTLYHIYEMYKRNLHASSMTCTRVSTNPMQAACSNVVGFESIDVNIPIVPATAMSMLKGARVVLVLPHLIYKCYVVFEKRASLSPNTIEALICLKDWSLAKDRMQEAVAEKAVAEEMINALASRPDWLQEPDDACDADVPENEDEHLTALS